jgi:hypothetical protein
MGRGSFAVKPGCLELEHRLFGSVALHPLDGQCRALNVAARLFQRLALVGPDQLARGPSSFIV